MKKTRENYNQTAKDYARTRAFISDDLKFLGKYAVAKDRILDSGCASGRLSEIFQKKEIDYFGIDFSEKLIDIAKKQYPKGKFQTANVLAAPFPENHFDKIYSISVIHNIPSKEFQLQYLKEMRRLLKPGGFLIVRVWDFWKRKQGWQLFLRYAFLKLSGKSELDFFDIFVPWKDSQGKIVVQRYFHCFTKKSIVNLVKKAGFNVKEVWRGGRKFRANIYIVAEK